MLLPDIKFGLELVSDVVTDSATCGQAECNVWIHKDLVRPRKAYPIHLGSESSFSGSARRYFSMKDKSGQPIVLWTRLKPFVQGLSRP